jgi:leucyl aminopeptidase
MILTFVVRTLTQDHASWTKAGYQSSFTIESTFADSDHNIHSGKDTSDYEEFSFDHMLVSQAACSTFTGASNLTN